MNTVTLAVAGSGKTQGIVDACSMGDPAKRRLILTYTRTGQEELERRLREECTSGNLPHVTGWFSFLIKYIIRPYLPAFAPGQVISGLNFHGDPGRYSKGLDRHFDSDNRVYAKGISLLANKVCAASSDAPISRLGRIYDEIHIDEVQDLCGNDLDILQKIMRLSGLEVHMVGDIRQSIYETNASDPKHKKYRWAKMVDWFRIQPNLTMLEKFGTWRNNQEIASFADSVFGSSLGLKQTLANRIETTNHNGVFAITEDQLDSYMGEYNPQLLRHNIVAASHLNHSFRTSGK